jgi:hypothetical protein
MSSLFVHRDTLRSVVDNDGQVFIFKILIEKVAKLRLRTDQMDPHRKSATSEDGSLNLRLGSLIGTNGVKRDVGEHWVGDYFASFISRTERPLYAPHLAQA